MRSQLKQAEGTFTIAYQLVKKFSELMPSTVIAAHVYTLIRTSGHTDSVTHAVLDSVRHKLQLQRFCSSIKHMSAEG